MLRKMKRQNGGNLNKMKSGSNNGGGSVQDGRTASVGSQAAIATENSKAKQIHLMLHNVDTVIGKIEHAGLAYPTEGRAFNQFVKLLNEVR